MLALWTTGHGSAGRARPTHPRHQLLTESSAAGLEAEKAATIRHGTRAVLTAQSFPLPWATVIVRKAYGVAAAAHFAPKG